MSDNYNPRRIAKNTLYLYLRMLLTVFLNLWATRLVLAGLGQEGMGVYSVVGSLIFFISFVSIGLTQAIQRFIAFELGRRDGDVGGVFSSCVILTVLTSLLLMVLFAVFGEIALRTFVSIPPALAADARWLLYLSSVGAVLTMLSVPYSAIVTAYERMSFFALVSVLTVVLNCLAAFLLRYIAPEERLWWYGLLLLAANGLVLTVYWLYCRRRIQTAHFRWTWNGSQLRQILSFMGISTVSNGIYVVYSQGIILLFNVFFGVAVNAVYTIATQLKNTLGSFGINIFRAASPQITKTYAEERMEEHLRLVYASCKAELYMILLLAIPFFFKAEYLLHLWLGEVPEYAVSFCRCVLVLTITSAIFEPIRTAVFATNRITAFLLVPQVCYMLLVLSVAYGLARWKHDPIVMMAGIIAVDIAICCMHVYYAARVTSITIAAFSKKVLAPFAMVTAVSMLLTKGLSMVFADNIGELLLLLSVHTLLFLGVVYAIGITPGERRWVNGRLQRVAVAVRSRH